MPLQGKVRDVYDNDDEEFVPIEETKALLDDIERDVDEMYYNSRSWLHDITEAGPLTKRAMNKLHRFDNFVGMTFRRMSEEFFKMPLFSDLNKNSMNGLNYFDPPDMTIQHPAAFDVQHKGHDHLNALNDLNSINLPATFGRPDHVNIMNGRNTADPMNAGITVDTLPVQNQGKDDSGEQHALVVQVTGEPGMPVEGINIIDPLGSNTLQTVMPTNIPVTISENISPSNNMNFNSLNGQVSDGQNFMTVSPAVLPMNSGDR